MSNLVYIVEDEDNIREILVCTFEAFGYLVKVFPMPKTCLPTRSPKRPT